MGYDYDKHKEFEQKMTKRCPNLYADMHGNPRETCMAFGLDVGPGWFPIIEWLSPKIEQEIVNMKYFDQMNPKRARCSLCGYQKRWHMLGRVIATIKFAILAVYLGIKFAACKLLRIRYRGLIKLPFVRHYIFARKPCRGHEVWYPRASQVKEKFGGLRFYMSTSTEAIDKLIDEAEYKCDRTCETCGKPGSLRGDVWVTTLCDKCNEPKD